MIARYENDIEVEALIDLVMEMESSEEEEEAREELFDHYANEV